MYTSFGKLSNVLKTNTGFFCHDKINFATRETLWGILQIKNWNDMIDAFNSISRYLDDLININNILNS